jgi:hypothetical protein
VRSYVGAIARLTNSLNLKPAKVYRFEQTLDCQSLTIVGRAVKAAAEKAAARGGASDPPLFPSKLRRVASPSSIESVHRVMSGMLEEFVDSDAAGPREQVDAMVREEPDDEEEEEEKEDESQDDGNYDGYSE